jgi:cytidylate kinase
MYTITISRQLGSHGLTVAQKTAESLGYRLVWRDMINKAALQSGSPEVALALIDELGLLDITPTPEASAAYHHAVRRLMEEMAHEGGYVILGRAGQAILHGHPSVLHVRLYAPAEHRAEQIASIQNISVRAAAAQIAASDNHRREYLKNYYEIGWDDPHLYDLMLNTAIFDPATAAALICCGLQRFEPQTTS